MDSCSYVLRGYIKDHVYYTNLPNVQEFQVEIRTVAEEIIGDMLHDTVNSFVVHLQ
jgi:hypothetical protein